MSAFKGSGLELGMSAFQGSGLEGCLHFRGLDQRGLTVHLLQHLLLSCDLNNDITPG